jgi:DNA modification methylase
VLQDAGDLDGTGYDEVDVAALLRELDEPVGLTDPDDVPDVPEHPKSESGFVWELGPHRLLVGDATDTECGRCCGWRAVDCVWTDPPYGVSYVGKTADALTIQNDGAGDAAALVVDAMKTAVAVAKPGSPVYVAHSDSMRVQFQQAMESAGVKYRQQLVWVKNVLVLGHADYQWRHEPILYGYTRARAGSGVGPVRVGTGIIRRRRCSRWISRRRSESHPTMKPVGLVERMIRNSCPAGWDGAGSVRRVWVDVDRGASGGVAGGAGRVGSALRGCDL